MWGWTRRIKAETGNTGLVFGFGLLLSPHMGYPPSTNSHSFGCSGISGSQLASPGQTSYSISIPYTYQSQMEGTIYQTDYGNMSFRTFEPRDDPWLKRGFAGPCTLSSGWNPTNGAVTIAFDLALQSTLGRCCERDGTCSQTTQMQCYEKCGIWTGPVGSGTGGTTGGTTGGEVDGSTTGQIPSCDECIEVPETETKCFKENPGGNWSKIGGCHSTESGCNGPPASSGSSSSSSSSGSGGSNPYP